VGGSGTAAGGTGGGRSLNICAETGPKTANPKSTANAGATRQRPPCHLRLPCLPLIMMDAFH
jgi:hypothetical protein